MDANCRMGGILDLSDSRSFEDLKPFTNKEFSTVHSYKFIPISLSTMDYQQMVAKPSEKVSNLPLELDHVVMTSSLGSVGDSTPGDSGVLTMSEISEMSASGLDLDCRSLERSLDDVAFSDLVTMKGDLQDAVMTQSDIENQNITPPMHEHIMFEIVSKESGDRGITENVDKLIEENGMKFFINEVVNVVKPSGHEKLTSNSEILDRVTSENNAVTVTPLAQCSQFSEISHKHSEMQKSASEENDSIVYRRRVKKKTQSAQKKRVSFHEDILKNTKTDNIHIEHGFITYKPERLLDSGRYSWCGEGDKPYRNKNNEQTQRKAQSDMLDYGKTDVLYFNPSDNSGVFEYGPQVLPSQDDNVKQILNSEGVPKLYTCSCSSSNSSLESDNTDENKNKNYDNTQKSYSCECIGSDSFQDNTMNENYYYSEPNIGTERDTEVNYNSYWSKEKKPKSSCLKKSSFQTDIVSEHDFSDRIKKFNAHKKSNFIDSKNLFGSLKNIYKQMSFGLSLTERGVPEGSEDLHSVTECIPDTETVKPKPFFSKSFDAGFCERSGSEFQQTAVRTYGDGYSRNYMHDVDAQLRRKNNDDIFSCDPYKQTSKNSSPKPKLHLQNINTVQQSSKQDSYRNKYIVNCESTVFEHTGVSYTYENDNFQFEPMTQSPTPTGLSPIVSTPSSSTPLIQKLSKMFKGLTDIKLSAVEKSPEKMAHNKALDSHNMSNSSSRNSLKKLSMTSSCDLISDNESFTTSDYSDIKKSTRTPARSHLREETKSGVSKHLASPLKKRNVIRYDKVPQSPDRYKLVHEPPKINILNSNDLEELLNIEVGQSQIDSDDILTIVSTVENAETVSQNYEPNITLHNITLKSAPSKTSLINRFLLNVTQRKALDSKLKNNEFFLKKVDGEQKLFKSLYVKSAHPDWQLSDDLDHEISMEVQQNSPKKFSSVDAGRNCLGEVDIEAFKDDSTLVYFRDKNEVLLKAFNTHLAYDANGVMTPVMLLLTGVALYVRATAIDTPRWRASIFVLPYADLDVILLGPCGQTLLFSNAARDMQCTLCPGGPGLAEAIASGVELCARLGPFATCSKPLPACGSLSVDHLTGLKKYVCDNSSVDEAEPWHSYNVVRIGDGLGAEPYSSPPLSGHLMHRALQHPRQNPPWQAGYFMLKAGVLYTFGDITQRLPSQALPLGPGACLGARRVPSPCRPHAFELLLPGGRLLQLAAGDEYATSDWLQALVQAASGLFEIPEAKPVSACSLILTSKHILTVREDFDSPLPPTISSTKHVHTRRTSAVSNVMSNSNITQTSKTLFSDMDRSISSTIDSKWEEMSLQSDTRSDSTFSKCDSRHEEKKSAAEFSYDGFSIGGASNKNCSIKKRFEFGKVLELLSCAAISDVIALKIPLVEESWCVLEFSCREVRESSGDMVVFFTNNLELERFISTLEALYTRENTPFPLFTLDSSDSLVNRCGDSFKSLERAWGSKVIRKMPSDLAAEEAVCG